ncbi:hypothetical protein GCM10025776_00580 [Corallincola platygyrae]
MFKWLTGKKKSKPQPATVSLKKRAPAKKQTPQKPQAKSSKAKLEAERKLKRLGLLKLSEQETVRAIRKYVRDNPKQAANLISLWIATEQQRNKK